VATQEAERRTGGDADGPAEKAQELASQAKEQVLEKADGVKSQASEQIRTQLNERSDQLGEHVTSFAQALHSAGRQLANDGKETGAKAAHTVADRVSQLGSYLSRSDADRFLHDIERFGRKRPWAAGAIGGALGFVAARFLKASSETRYQTGRVPTGRPPLTDTGARVDRSAIGPVTTESPAGSRGL
jgi:ElaB/YqjD/DUF883 family membrane-anchored ribosome-binding protein